MCRNLREISRTCIEGMEVLLVGNDDFDFDPRLTDGIAAVMLGEAALIPAGYVVEADVYTSIGLDLGERAALRAALCEGDIILGKNSAVLRWLHADGSIFLRRGSIAYGRLSAGRSIRLERGCGFERMSAPQIITVDPDQGDTIPPAHAACESEPHLDVRRHVHVVPSAASGSGRFRSPCRRDFERKCHCHGRLALGPGARLFGSAKSYKDTVIDEEACVHGSIVSGGTMRLGPRALWPAL